MDGRDNAQVAREEADLLVVGLSVELELVLSAYQASDYLGQHLEAPYPDDAL